MTEPKIGYRPIRYRLTDEDRAAFGGPEWVTFDRRELFKLPSSELMKIETAINATVGQFLTSALQGSAFGTKATIFIARRFAGIKEDFEKFDPHIFEMDSEPVGEESDEEPDPTSLPSDGLDRPE